MMCKRQLVAVGSWCLFVGRTPARHQSNLLYSSPQYVRPEPVTVVVLRYRSADSFDMLSVGGLLATVGAAPATDR
jgi:hypothetical protein